MKPYHYLFCLSNLECGDGDPTLPIVEVGHRPIDGEGEAHQGHQGPHQSVHQGQGPVWTDSFYNPKLSNLRFLTGTNFYETLCGDKGRTKICKSVHTDIINDLVKIIALKYLFSVARDASWPFTVLGYHLGES